MIHEGRQEVVCTAKEVLVMYDFIKRSKTAIPDRLCLKISQLTGRMAQAVRAEMAFGKTTDGQKRLDIVTTDGFHQPLSLSART